VGPCKAADLALELLDIAVDVGAVHALADAVNNEDEVRHFVLAGLFKSLLLLLLRLDDATCALERDASGLLLVLCIRFLEQPNPSTLTTSMSSRDENEFS